MFGKSKEASEVEAAAPRSRVVFIPVSGDRVPVYVCYEKVRTRDTLLGWRTELRGYTLSADEALNWSEKDGVEAPTVHVIRAFGTAEPGKMVLSTGRLITLGFEVVS